MSLATLETTATDFGGEGAFLSTYLAEYNRSHQDAELENWWEMHLETAKAQLVLDLQEMLDLNPDDSTDMATIDEIVDANPARLRRVLALLQIIACYAEINDTPESATGRRWSDLRREYANSKKAFPGLRTTRGASRISSVSLRV